MKKGFVVMVAVLLVLAVAVPAMAASPAAGDVGIVDGEGNPVEVTVTQMGAGSPLYESAKAAIGIKSTQKLFVYDITVSGGVPPYTVSIPYAGAASATMYHYTGGAWVKLATTYKNGVATAQTDSFSPFALVVSDTAETASKSPKTGADSMMWLLPVMMICAAGAVYAGFRAAGARK